MYAYVSFREGTHWTWIMKRWFFASIVCIFWWACRGPFVCIIDGFSPQTHKLGRKLPPKCHLNWRVKVSGRNWAQQKHANNAFVRQNLQRRQDNRLYVMKWRDTRGRPCHGFPCDACCVNLEFEFLNQLRWVGCASNQGIIATIFWLYIPLLRDFQGTLRTYHSPCFPFGESTLENPHRSSHTWKNSPSVFREKPPNFQPQIWWTTFQGGDEIERWERLSPVFQTVQQFRFFVGFVAWNSRVRIFSPEPVWMT